MHRRYIPVSDLGRGAQGRVFLAKDTLQDQSVVVKEVSLSSTHVERAEQEFRILSKLSHPRLFKMLDFGFDRDRASFFWTTEYLPGVTFEKTGRISFREGLDYLVQVLRCLEYLHSQGILHLDIKPSNLYLTDDGTVKILDLGMSRLVHEGEGLTGGTYAYASPEQLLGKGVDGRSDLYSLGITFYELFSGRHPFEAKSVTDMVFHHLQTEPPLLSETARGIPGGLDPVFLRLVAKDREDRFLRGSEVIGALNTADLGPFPIEETSGWEGYKKTGLMGEFREELSSAMEMIDSQRPGAPPFVQLIGLRQFPEEGVSLFIEQLFFLLKFSGRDVLLVRSDENWMALFVQLMGESPAGDYQGLTDLFLSLLREKRSRGGFVFLFERDPLVSPSFKEVLDRVERFDPSGNPILLVGPFSDPGEALSVTWDEKRKTRFVPRPIKDTEPEFRGILGWFALHDEGIPFDDLTRLCRLPFDTCLKQVQSLTQQGLVGYHKNRLTVLNRSVTEALAAEIEEEERQEMIARYLKLNPPDDIRGILLFRKGEKGEAKSLLMKEIRRALQSYQFEKASRLSATLKNFLDDADAVRLVIEVCLLLGNYQQALLAIDHLSRSDQPVEVAEEYKRRQGWLYYKTGQHKEALQSYQEALELAQESRNEDEAASLGNEISYLVFKTGDINRALSLFEQHAADFGKIGNPLILSNNRYDVVLAAAGKKEEAWAVYQKKIDLLKNEADPRVHINLSLTEAYLYQLQKDWEKAHRLYEKILESCRKNHIYSPQEGIMENLKNIKLELGKDVTQPALRAEQPPSNWIPGKPERLFEVLEDISSEEQLQSLLEKVVDYAIDLTGGLRGFLLLRKEDVAGVPQFTIRVARNFEERPQGEVPVSFTFLRKVFQTGRAMVTVDASSDPDLKAMTSVMKFDLRSIVCAPLKIKNKNIGVLYLDHPLEKGLFSEAQLKDLEVLAHQSALAIDKVQLIGRLKQSEEELRNELIKSSDLLVLSEQELEKLRIRLQQSQRQQKTRFPYERIIGQSVQMTKMLQTLDKLTNTHIPIFIFGESGTGKELVARALHFNSDRKKGSFISVNCGAIPENLMESEFFGAQKGAYTGAVKDTAGLFEQANGGTLFLDEIGEMPLHLQVKLLRVLQEKKVRRLGGQAETPIDVRIITASNRDLQQLVKKKLFREDLFYRLAAVKVTLPPLRDRRADIPLLVGHFLGKFAQEHGLKRTLAVTRGVMKKLLGYSWPGNVRELEHVITNACLMKEGAKIEEGDLQFLDTSVHGIAEETPDAGTMRLVFDEKKRWEDYETEIFGQLILLFGGNKSKAAKQLGLSRTTLNKKLPST